MNCAGYMESVGVLNARDRCLVVGKTGTGKSTWVKRHVARELSTGRRVVAADLHDEYSVAGDDGGGHVTVGPLANHLSMESLLDRADLLDLPRLSMAVVLRPDEEDCAEDFDALARLIYSTGNMVFVADELGHYSERCGGALKKLATLGRHRGLTLILASQRMVDIPPKARAQASVAVFFRQDHPADLDAIADLTRSPETSDAVSRLAVGEFILWRDSIGPQS